MKHRLPEVQTLYQRLFDDVMTHMRDQLSCAMVLESNVTCAYLNEGNGRKCAIGGILNEEQITLVGGNRVPATDSSIIRALVASGYPVESYRDDDFLVQIQRQLHDGLRHNDSTLFSEILESTAVTFARVESVTYTPLAAA